MLKYGLEVNEIVASELPGIPSAVWTLKLNRDEQYDAYIVLSFTNGTLVLSIGETVASMSRFDLSAGETVTIRTAGGGGYGLG